MSGESADQQGKTFMTYDQRNLLIISLLAVLIFILTITLVYLLMPPFLDWLRRRRARKFEGSRKERRYQTIEGWLITKRIQPHNEGCEKIKKMICQACKSDSDLPCSPIKAATSCDSSDTAHSSCDTDAETGEERECPICMEPFAVDDIVSWSPNIDGTCKHVFHHECIKEWMLQSGNCPCCRELILPIDEEGHSLERSALKELCRKRARLAATSYYCLLDGLVCFEAPGKCSRETFTILKLATACRVVPADVSGRRGYRSQNGQEDNKDIDVISEINTTDEQEMGAVVAIQDGTSQQQNCEPDQSSPLDGDDGDANTSDNLEGSSSPLIRQEYPSCRAELHCTSPESTAVGPRGRIFDEVTI